MRPCFPSLLSVVGTCVLTAAWAPRVSAAPDGAGIVIDASGLDDPSRDPPEPGAPDGDAAGQVGQSARIPCLEDLSPDGDPRKGVQKRPFLKHRRFEISALGGLYASDVLSSAHIAGGAVSYFPAEDFGLELLVTRAPVEFRLQEPIAGFDQINRFPSDAAYAAFLSMLYAPFHAKFKFSEESIFTGDIFLVGGVGRTYHDSVQGLTWEAGIGLKLYLWEYIAFRLDIRDFVQPQEILGQAHITNNIAVMGGLSFWAP